MRTKRNLCAFPQTKKRCLTLIFTLPTSVSCKKLFFFLNFSLSHTLNHNIFEFFLLFFWLPFTIRICSSFLYYMSLVSCLPNREKKYNKRIMRMCLGCAQKFSLRFGYLLTHSSQCSYWFGCCNNNSSNRS